MREVQYLAFIANSFGRNLLASSTNRLPSILVSSKKRSRCIEPELWKRWAASSLAPIGDDGGTNRFPHGAAPRPFTGTRVIFVS
jgi:hypothetical protein